MARTATMTNRDFAFWLQGFFEIGNPKELTAEQQAEIRIKLGSLRDSNQLDGLASYVEAILDMNPPTGLNPTVTDLLRKRLNARFEHAVPTDGSDFVPEGPHPLPFERPRPPGTRC